MTTEYYVAIDVPMHRFEIRCENQPAMLRLAAHAGEQWKDALADREYRSIVQVQGDHGMISIHPHIIQHIESFVREDAPVRYDWSEPLPLRHIGPLAHEDVKRHDEANVRMARAALRPKPRRSLIGRLLRRLT